MSDQDWTSKSHTKRSITTHFNEGKKTKVRKTTGKARGEGNRKPGKNDKLKGSAMTRKKTGETTAAAMARETPQADGTNTSVCLPFLLDVLHRRRISSYNNDTKL